MADNTTTKNNPLMESLATITTPENVQKYILGTKKNGDPRAIYDIIRDYTKPKSKKKKKHKKKNKYKENPDSSYALYVTTKKKGKKKKKKKKNKHWHI